MRLPTFLLLTCVIVCTKAGAQTGAGGIVYGKDHAYFLQAPQGWVMGAADASQERVSAVFHPENAHWPASKVIIYTDLFEKTKDVQTPVDAMRADVARFKEDGSAVRPIRKPPIKTNLGGLSGSIYYLGPDKRGRFDARAYFTSGKYIDYFVLTACDKSTFEKSLPAFAYIVRSYAPQLKIVRDKIPLKNT